VTERLTYGQCRRCGAYADSPTYRCEICGTNYVELFPTPVALDSTAEELTDHRLIVAVHCATMNPRFTNEAPSGKPAERRSAAAKTCTVRLPGVRAVRASVTRQVDEAFTAPKS
jgi:hypothetical protein